MEMSGRGKGRRYTLVRRLVGAQSRSASGGEEKKKSLPRLVGK